MGFKRTKSTVIILDEERKVLERVCRSRKIESAVKQRAQILLNYADGRLVSGIARQLGVARSTVYRCIDKALQFGWRTALHDLKRCGRPPTITPEARSWLTSIACNSPKLLGSSYERWTQRYLARYVRKRCRRAGHPSLQKVGSGTVCKILNRNTIKPHRISYYLERRDPDFDRKMKAVLDIYQKVNDIRSEKVAASNTVYISYDEKPGIQAINNKAADRPPLPGKYKCWGRDSEYVRLGTLSLLAGMDLLTGDVHGLVADRHRSCEFVEFLKHLLAAYPKRTTFCVILDNHSAHTSEETRKFLATVPNRFKFIFTPTHGSWLNVIESFFSKMSRSVLRGIRVKSKRELTNRIIHYLDELNKDPVAFHWKYLLEEESAHSVSKLKRKYSRTRVSELERIVRSIMKDTA